MQAPDFNFQSTRLTTSSLKKEDAPKLYEIYSDKKAMKYRGSKAMESIDDAFTMINNQYLINNQLSKLRLGIYNKEDKQLLGTLLLVWNNVLMTQCELGFSFGKAFWNKGYGKETLKMIEETFRCQSNFKELKAWCIKENLGSVRIFEQAACAKIEQDEYPQSYLYLKFL